MIDFPFYNIDTSFNCYEQFTKFYALTKDVSFENINISLNKWFGANMSAVLGGILDKLSLYNSIEIKSTDKKILDILQRNEFLASYGYPLSKDAQGTTIKYLKLKSDSSRYFNSYVMNELLSKAQFPSMTDALKKKIAESIYEIFVNAQMHSESDYIYTCGQHFPKKNKIEFTIVDMGIGFKNNINKRFGMTLDAVKSIRWATTEGHTTKTTAPGGIGLAILKEFIKMNSGKFQIVSDDGFYEIEGDSDTAKFLTNPFPGTIVNMEFRTDDAKSYRLASEFDLDNIF